MTLVTLVSLFILSYLAVDIFYGIVVARFQQVDIREEETRKAPTKKAMKKVTLNDFRVIAERNIFGISGKPAENATGKGKGTEGGRYREAETHVFEDRPHWNRYRA